MANEQPFDPETARKFSLKSMLPSLLMDVILPIAAFNILVHYGVSTLVALVSGGIFPAISIAYDYAKTRQVEPLGIIVLGFLALGTATSLLSGNIFFALVKDSMLTAAFGLMCLGSLLGARPLPFYIIRQFLAADNPAVNAWWNGLWEMEGFRRSMRKVTMVWGAAYVIEAIARVMLAMAVSPATVVTISPVMAFGLAIGIAIWTRNFMLAQRDKRLREEQLKAQAAASAL